MSSLPFVRSTRARTALIEELRSRTRGGALTHLLDDLPRRLRRLPRPTPRALGRRVADAYVWEADDRRDPDWWPQGVTTWRDARALGADPAGLGERRIVVVSWYAKHGQGVRLSIADLDTGRYRHVLLVKPITAEDGSVGIEPVKVHAGGIVWSGSWIHVAATKRGCVSAHLDDLLWLPERDALGADTFGYRWVLPTRVDHRGGMDEDATEERLRWSFMSLDPASARRDQPSLLVGEYGRGDASTRIARFPIAADGQPAGASSAERTTHATEVLDAELTGMQGVADVRGRLHATTSHGPMGPGSLLVREGERWRRTPAAVPMGPEDLAVADDLLWTPTEHPRRRLLVAMRPF